jgi:hypothetical protein
MPANDNAILKAHMQAVLTPDCRSEPATNRLASRALRAGLDVLRRCIW